MHTDFIFSAKDFFPFVKKISPYTSENEYRQDSCLLISAYLQLGISIFENSDHTDGFLWGGTFSTEDLIAYLDPNVQKMPLVSEETRQFFLKFETQIQERLSVTPDAEENFLLRQLAHRFFADSFAFFCIQCALACSYSHSLSSFYRIMQDESDAADPTVGLLASLYGLIHPIPSTDAMLLYGKEAPSALLFEQLPFSSVVQMPVRLHPHVLAFLSHTDYRSSDIWSSAQWIYPSDDRSKGLCQEQYRAAYSMLTAQTIEPCGRLIALCGPTGSGKKSTLKQLAQQTGYLFLILPLSQLSTGEKKIEDFLLYLLLDHTLLCLEDDDFTDRNLLSSLHQTLHILAPYSSTVFLLAQELRQMPVQTDYLCRRIDFPLPEQKVSVQLWNTLAQPYSLSNSVHFPEISSRFSLTPGQIQNALQDAAINASGEEITPEQLRDSILRNNTTRLNLMADRIEPFYTWDDLILDDTSKQMLKNVCNRIKYKYQVQEEWGFRQKSSYGNGVSVLLYGPPGTGKTMSAQVLARELWLPLYRINLAQITSKYIGETAKNLDAIFREAKNSNVILFFDEADALFSKRTDIKNSNDRHANSETSYLLQKIEEFSGVSILATNLANHFDEAFRRRIQYMINIHMPSEEQRMTLWKHAFPPQAPLNEDIDFSILAASLEISGSVIKAAVTQAAFFAAEENTSISMRHLVRAVRAELQKLSKPEPSCLQIY